jgi:TIR domain-containing protein
VLFDVFICHASEDKDALVRPVAERLREHHVEVWYDEFTLKPGDSLRRAIDKGLASSRLGVVILSPSFFAKSWPHWELDGLVQRELAAKDPVIIPVWHRVSHDDILKYSPPLADKVAIASRGGPDDVARRLLELIHPRGSTLLIARDLVLDFGGAPPVVTDDWWLDAVEASASNPVEDTFQSASGWGRWGFPLPPRGDSPQERGQRLGWAAMQMSWRRAAREQKISQVTHPEAVLRFIDSQSGLRETCEDYPEYLACYAPQLTLRGFGGPFEPVYEKALADDLASSSPGTHTTRRPALRREWLALRHPAFESFDAAGVACDFVQGFTTSFGPEVKAYATIDYIAWFLSSASGWLPEPHRRFLLRGLKEWAVWPWSQGANDDSEYPFDGMETTGALFDQMLEARPKARACFRMSADSEWDLVTRLEHSARVLALTEQPQELAGRFVAEGFIEEWFARQERSRARQAAQKPRSKPQPKRRNGKARTR